MLTRGERARALALAGAIVALHLVGLGLLLAAGGAVTAGVGLTAYTLGLRHAFDADHIAAIDNTTCKLMSDGRRPLGVGFCFSLGHSTVVLVLAALFAVGIKALGHGGSMLHSIGGLVGTGVSGTFLYVIAALNLVVLVGLVRGARSEDELEALLQSRGLMNRLLGRFSDRITESWHMYPLGVLFGLGFDTATEVGLLLLAAGAAGAGLPWYAILCLPILFAAGMALLDTLDGSFMNFAYGWAFSEPVRKLYYNLTITGLSVVVALVIGTIELLSIAAQRLDGGFWQWVSGIDLNALGYIVFGLFAVTWAAAVAVWRLARIEERWAPAANGRRRGAAPRGSLVQD
jgi:high-affinity nickel-transport protein